MLLNYLVQFNSIVKVNKTLKNVRVFNRFLRQEKISSNLEKKFYLKLKFH